MRGEAVGAAGGPAGISIEEAALALRWPPGRVRGYVRRGLVGRPVPAGTAVVLTAADLARLRQIRRLTEDMGVNVAGVEVVLHLLDVIRDLRGEQPARPRRVRIVTRG